ncbi:MAG TPA: carboxymuconolactone decarboxylase family protein [Polyangiales bacterium]|nr:carboxymuconolactone decarboxylase family protein [Polyangiales bacterium]
MRLQILDSGHNLATKAMFALIRVATRSEVLDIIKLVKYRADFYGKPMCALTHKAMRGPSQWSVGGRELMAAVVAQANSCRFCAESHAEVASAAYGDETRVAAALEDLERAPLDPGLRGVLQMPPRRAAGEQGGAAGNSVVCARYELIGPSSGIGFTIPPNKPRLSLSRSKTRAKIEFGTTI